MNDLQIQKLLGTLDDIATSLYFIAKSLAYDEIECEGCGEPAELPTLQESLAVIAQQLDVPRITGRMKPVVVSKDEPIA